MSPLDGNKQHLQSEERSKLTDIACKMPIDATTSNSRIDSNCLEKTRQTSSGYIRLIESKCPHTSKNFVSQNTSSNSGNKMSTYFLVKAFLLLIVSMLSFLTREENASYETWMLWSLLFLLLSAASYSYESVRDLANNRSLGSYQKDHLPV
ncbi:MULTISPECIES: hypothetical protein [Candidatus Ichthyocystis]|uniref:Putative membrane protein n=1 Tax=Candidatus Ichthyocystis hellenicum TaxID=1561003 RepID=A0A0S4LZW5_9BURK|nr:MULTISPECIES: hypothetical protein [Ichthyocystis]CUT17113.1 putative membrane protein [Candidatus Ichthyocystis hellenicum]